MNNTVVDQTVRIGGWTYIIQFYINMLSQFVPIITSNTEVCWLSFL